MTFDEELVVGGSIGYAFHLLGAVSLKWKIHKLRFLDIPSNDY